MSAPAAACSRIAPASASSRAVALAVEHLGDPDGGRRRAVEDQSGDERPVPRLVVEPAVARMDVGLLERRRSSIDAGVQPRMQLRRVAGVEDRHLRPVALAGGRARSCRPPPSGSPPGRPGCTGARRRRGAARPSPAGPRPRRAAGRADRPAPRPPAARSARCATRAPREPRAPARRGGAARLRPPAGRSRATSSSFGRRRCGRSPSARWTSSRSFTRAERCSWSTACASRDGPLGLAIVANRRSSRAGMRPQPPMYFPAVCGLFSST